MENFQEAWDKALSLTEIIRTRVSALQTFQDTRVQYILLSSSSVNEGDTVVRKGEVVVQKPSLILPPNVPQFEGFEFDNEKHELNEEGMLNFLLVRGVNIPSMKYNNRTHSLDVFEGELARAVDYYENNLQREENVSAGLLTGPEDVWQFSVLIFICSQIARNTQTDIKRLLDDYHKRQRDS